MTDKELQAENQAQDKVLQIFGETFRPVFGNLDHIRINQELAEIKKQERVVATLKPQTAAYSRELGVLVAKKKNAVWLIKQINEALKGGGSNG